MTAIQNIGLAVFPFVNGLLRDMTKSYTASLLMFAGLGVVGLVFALLLKRADRREGRDSGAGRKGGRMIGTSSPIWGMSCWGSTTRFFSGR